ncbi:formate/nitrite transporter [Dongia mobilis]|uniref:Formate/nitrite transporter n=1 Tax=Dongia mobilis TaxID=578943 RepID=A0A4R6X114_9PROT|nr:formate/nitrite transporter family protein [Dongia mobilis]TDQ84148.1 formate/nitrite transporter [Dongia mobilis]
MTGLDALLPEEIARKAEDVGIAKAGRDALTLFTLAVLAGAFIALGAMLSTLTAIGIGDALPFGLARLAIGATFSLGLILVVICGAELFTGDVLMTIAWASRRLGAAALLRVWAIVLAGNFVGGVGTALLVFLSGHLDLHHGAAAATALAIAEHKAGLGAMEAFWRGVMCNVLVCLAVWGALAARSVTDRILVVVPPVTAFVAAGFEHSIANFYFLGIGWLLDAGRIGNPLFLLAGQVPVIAGNLAGGACLVALVYWIAYLRPRRT